jgi:hypothetical protein
MPGRDTSFYAVDGGVLRSRLEQMIVDQWAAADE